MNLKTTPYEEWSYIWITSKELIRIIITNWIKKFSEKNFAPLGIFRNLN
jgi:hypothetical protein